ncbi:squalene/phytoene synthase family protein, partial [Streptomyces sp. NPDC048845]|uniref:squalene/phytoene synthase family protein n=1 Tax=Streptomyces sp. NPDC048845 TaxID=3155390 RepID=UPI0034375404
MRAVLSRAAIDDPALRAAYLACGRAVRAADPADYALMRLMPPEVRPACWALRAATGSHVAAPALAAPAGASPGGDSPGGRAGTGADPATDPVRTALADCVRRWNLNPQELHPPRDSADGHGHGPATWQQWRTCARQRRRLLWLEQVLLVLSRHGVPVYGWLLRQENFESGLHLTDALAYLSDDITRGRLTLPAEVLDAFPTAAPALLERRWTPAVHALVAHLAGQARRWLRRPPLAHPGLAVLLRTTTRLCLARLDAVEAAGPALLHHTPRPALPVRLRIVTPAQALAVAAWRIAPLTAPPAVRGPRPSAAAALIPAQARHDRTGVP